MIESEAIQAEEPAIALGGREQLFHLLAEASEVEHTLMCSYLYAAFSLDARAAAKLNARDAAVVSSWYKAILAVATEEMTHLLLVANLTIAIGGRPHFGRPNFPVAPGYFPSGVVVRLQGFSLETLDHFIYLERPRGVEHKDGEGFEPKAHNERTEAYTDLMPSLQDYRTVGHLYDAIRENLKATAQRLGEAALFIGPVEGQIDKKTVRLEGVLTVCDLASALRIIDVIVEQGEGSATGNEQSHYQRFLAIRSQYEDLLERSPDFSPAFPVATNPVMRLPPEPDDKVFIDDPAAARVLDFANGVYGLILRLLVHGFGREGGDGRAATQRNLAGAIGLMHVLDRAGRALAAMPARSNDLTIHAGLTFTMLRSVNPMFVRQAEDEVIAERLAEAVASARVAARTNPALSSLPASVVEIAVAFAKTEV